MAYESDSDSGQPLPFPSFGDTLQEAINKKFGNNAIKLGKNFNKKGWNYYGKTTFPCLKCDNSLDSFRCKYESLKKVRPYHWSLYCSTCDTLIGPSSLNPEQREALYATVSPEVSKKSSREVLKPSRSPKRISTEDIGDQDKAAIDAVYEIVKLMRNTSPIVANMNSFELIGKVSSLMGGKD